MLARLLQWDREAFIYLNSLGIEKYDSFWTTVTDIATWTPLFLLFFVLLLLKYPLREGLAMILTAGLLILFILWFTDFTKDVGARLRPNNDTQVNTLIRVLRNPVSFSFFSGHASSSFSLTTLVFLFLRPKFKWAALFFLWPLLFASSRIYVGVHYPLDIFVGALVGVFSALLFYRGFLRLKALYIR